VTALLKRGLTTTSAGGFFFIPYLLQLAGHDLAVSLGPVKQEGLHNERIALGIVFESIFGYTDGIRTVDSVSRADFGLLAGLPFLVSPSSQYRFLQSVRMKNALDFQRALAKRLVHRIENITSNAGKIASPYISIISYEIMDKCSQKDHYFLDNKIS